MSKISKFLNKSLCSLIVFSLFSQPLLAETQYIDSIGSNSNDIIIGVDITQSKTTEYYDEIENIDNNIDTKVYVTQASTFNIIIPKTIILDGQDGLGNYIVTVDGNFAGNEIVSVVPDDIFYLHQQNKNDVLATISQNKKHWRYNQTNVIGVGEIFADLTAGSWSGLFNFNISLRENIFIISASNDKGDDLDAVGFSIDDTTKENTLLDQLVAQNFVNDKNSVDAIIEINTNDFENSANAIFDVSSIANEGDTVVIVHYNNTTNQWEYIGSVVVKNDGTINANFTSFSPVALIVKKKPTLNLGGTNNNNTVSYTNSTNKTTYQINDNTQTKIELNYDGDVQPNIENSDNSIVDAIIVGNEIIITPKKEGVATITIKVPETDNQCETKETINIDISHNYVNGHCTRCDQIDIEQLPAGLYDNSYNLKTSWETLKNNGTIHVDENGVFTTNPIYNDKYGIVGNNSNAALTGILILSTDVKSYTSHSLAGCHNLSQIVLSESVESCTGFYNATINSVIVKNNNNHYKTVDGILYSKNMDELVFYPTGIKNSTFEIPLSVKTIKSCCFMNNTYINNVVPTNNLEYIEDHAFCYCSNLYTFNVPLDSKLKSIGACSFVDTKISSFTIPDTVTEIGKGALRGTKITKIFIPTSVTKVSYDIELSGNGEGSFPTGQSSLKIYCETLSQPSTWPQYWNAIYYKQNAHNSLAPVYWGYTREQFNALP